MRFVEGVRVQRGSGSGTPFARLERLSVRDGGQRGSIPMMKKKREMNTLRDTVEIVFHSRLGWTAPRIDVHS